MGIFSKDKSTTRMGVHLDKKAVKAESPLINREVEEAASKYEKVEAKLDTLLTALKQQHKAMSEANMRKLETINIIQDFARGTPLETIVGIDHVEKAPVSEDAEKKGLAALEEAPAVDMPKEPSVPEEDEAAEEEEEDAEEEPEKSNEDAEEETPAEDDTTDEEDTKPTAEGVSEEEDVVAAKMNHPFEEAEEIKVEMEDPTFSDVHKNIFDTSTAHLEEYIDEVVKYLEAWKKVNKTRIKAGLYEFNELSEKLDHYEMKVKGLQNSKNKERLERNEQKLLGVQEAHASYSDRLLCYIEEVTKRGWKDFYPLLLHVLQFDQNYTAGQFKFTAHLNHVIENLKQVGEEHGLQPEGRLLALEKEPLGEVYTGNRKKNKLPLPSLNKVLADSTSGGSE